MGLWVTFEPMAARTSPYIGPSFAPQVGGGMQQQQQQHGDPGQMISNQWNSPSLAPSYNPYQSMQSAPSQPVQSFASQPVSTRQLAPTHVVNSKSKPPLGVLSHSSENSVRATGWAGIGLFFERWHAKEHPVVVEVMSGGSSAREVASLLPSPHLPPRPAAPRRNAAANRTWLQTAHGLQPVHLPASHPSPAPLDPYTTHPTRGVLHGPPSTSLRASHHILSSI